MSGRRGTPEEALPLSPLEFSVLLVLSDAPLYGYAIVKAIGERWAGSVRLASGNLYQILDRLLGRGWIREMDRREAPGADGRRRYYELTPAGRAVVAAEADRLRELVRSAARMGVIEPLEGRS